MDLNLSNMCKIWGYKKEDNAYIMHTSLVNFPGYILVYFLISGASYVSWMCKKEGGIIFYLHVK